MNPLDVQLLVIVDLIGSAIPWFLVRQNRRWWAVTDALFHAVALGLIMLAPGFDLTIGGSTLFALFIVARLALVVLFLTAGGPSDRFRLTPIRAGICAGVVYLILVPHVLQWPIDGDEPFYLLVTESIVEDLDLDLRNQYSEIESSVVERPDLVPQPGDPVGSEGEQYSRHEPLLSLILLPGYLLGGLPGAVATIAIFGGLLVWSAMRLVIDEGLSQRAMVVTWPFLAFGPPVLFYSTRIWPEVPAAFFLSEALRAARARRYGWLVGSLLLLSALKLRFVIVAIPVLGIVMLWQGRRWRLLAALALVVAVPTGLAWLVTGHPLAVHRPWELVPGGPIEYLRGAAGLVLDGQAGMLFQAPAWLVGLCSLMWWRRLPDSLRLGTLSAIPYVLLLIPRSEWHGGWSPPLRYLVVFAPLFALGLAWAVETIRPAWLILLGAWSAAISVHGISRPYRLFHIASGESVLGEFLSDAMKVDFARVMPSLIRPNDAVWWWALALVVVVLTVRFMPRWGKVPASAWIMIVAFIPAIALGVASRPGSVVHFEDAHVGRDGGELHPERWTVARFRYRGGWSVSAGDSLRFRYEGGLSKLVYRSRNGAVVRIGGESYRLPPSNRFAEVKLDLPRDVSEWELTTVRGDAILDRLEHE